MQRTRSTPSSDEQQRILERLRRTEELMDSAFRIPVLGKRIGFDGLLGLVPVVGDLAGALVGGIFLLSALQLGLPRRALAAMVANLAIDFFIGSVPVIGDAFDLFFKSHRRNLRVVERHLGAN